MKTFQVQNGDLVLSNGSFATVEGAAKVQQDLGMAVATPYGSDPFHPKYGSVIQSHIGEATGPMTDLMVRSEISRVISNYQAIQTATVNSYTSKGQRPPFGEHELVDTIQTIQVQQDYDTLEVSAVITTMSGYSMPVQATVTPNSVTTGI